MKVAELDTIMMKKANLNVDFAQLGVMPDPPIQEASPHFLSITSWKLLLKHCVLGIRWQHGIRAGVLRECWLLLAGSLLARLRALVSEDSEGQSCRYSSEEEVCQAPVQGKELYCPRSLHRPILRPH